MPLAQHGLDVLRDFRVIQRVVDVVGLAGAAVGEGDVEVDLSGFAARVFPIRRCRSGSRPEFAQKDDVHVVVRCAVHASIPQHERQIHIAHSVGIRSP